MALQVRRGTNAERLGITPLAGELVYTTDTKQLYVGDGATAGGITSIAGTIDSLLADTTPQLGGTLDLNGNDITGAGNININGTITATGNINLGDGAGSDVISVGGSLAGHLLPSEDTTWNLGALTYQFKEAWISQLNVENQITAGRINASLIADDSTVVFDASTGLLAASQLTGSATINVIGNVIGNVTGNLTGDVQGSVFGDDSTLIIDGINNTVNAVSVTTNNLITNRITNPTGSLSVSTDSIVKPNLTVDVVSLDNVSTIALTRASAADISGDPAIYGRLVFTRNDLNGSFTSSLVSGARDYVALFNDPAGNNADPSKYLLLTNGKLSMGAGSSPSATLEVAGSIKPGVYADATARDAAISSPTAGEMVFVTDVAKFQGYDGSAWANLN